MTCVWCRDVCKRLMFVELKSEFPSDQRRSDVMSWVKVKLEEITWKHSCVKQTRQRAHHYVNRGRLIRCVRVATAHYCCESSSSSLHLEKCNCSCRKRGTTKAFLHLIMELKGKVWMNLWWIYGKFFEFDTNSASYYEPI